MQPTRPQTEELKDLSQKLYGASSRWQKLQERTPVFDGVDEKKNPVFRRPTIEELLDGLRILAKRSA